jgi:hypothetical protein
LVEVQGGDACGAGELRVPQRFEGLMIDSLMITNFLMDNSALVPVVLSVVPVVALTLVPTSGRAYAVCVVQFSLPTLATVELLANVALFFPLVFFATLATRRPLLMLVAGVGLSAAIEALQAVVPAIGRACDTNDWIMNSIGTISAVLLARATFALANRATVRETADIHAEIPSGDRPGDAS